MAARLRSFLSPVASGRWVVVASLLVNLFVVALAGLALRQSYVQYQDRAGGSARNISQVLERSLDDVIDKIDLVLLAVVDEYKRQQAAGGVDERSMNDFLARQHDRIPEIDGLRMVNAGGKSSTACQLATATGPRWTTATISSTARDNSASPA